MLFNKRKTLNQMRQEALEAAHARKFELELERDAIDGALDGLEKRIKRLEYELEPKHIVDSILRDAAKL